MTAAHLAKRAGLIERLASGPVNDYQRVVIGLLVFSGYDHEVGVHAEHDEVYAGPPSEEMSAADRATVEALGWVPDEGCWLLYT